MAFCSIKTKLSALMALSALILLMALVTFSTIARRRATVEYSEARAVTITRDYADRIAEKLNAALQVSQTLGSAFSRLASDRIEADRANAVLRDTLLDNPELNAAFLAWGPNSTPAGLSWKSAFRWVRCPAGSAPRLDPRGQLDCSSALLALLNDGGASRHAVRFTLHERRGPLLLAISSITGKGATLGAVGVDVRLSDFSAFLDEAASRAFAGRAFFEIVSSAGETIVSSGNKPETTNPADSLSFSAPIVLNTVTEPWKVKISVPYSQIAEGPTRQMWMGIALGTAVIALTLAFFVYFIGRVVAPIKELCRITRQVAEGRWDRGEIPAVSNDEIGALARDFENMLRKREKVENALKDAIVRAEKANRSKTEFLSNISHEFRTPLNGILASTDILESEMTPDQMEFLDIIRKSGLNLLKLIENVIALAKIENDCYAIVRVAFSLREMVNSVETRYASAAREKNLRFSRVMDENIPDRLIGDGAHLTEILGHLVDNAIKYTISGEVSMRARRVKSDRGEIAIEFRVQDTGIGVPADKRDMVFQYFTQADNSSTRSYEGAGLGLSIAARLTRLMGGEMFMESEVGKGSVFYFILPFAVEEAALPSAAKSADGVDNTDADAATAEERVEEGFATLIVSEDAETRETLSWCVQLLNGVASEENDARAALKGLASENYRLAFIDMGTNDYPAVPELIAALRAREAAENRPRAVLIALLDHMPPGSPASGWVPDGFDAYILTPIIEGAVIELIERWTRGQKNRSGARS